MRRCCACAAATAKSIGPATILPVAEKVGLIAQIDHRVLELALQRMVAEPDLRVSVNISAATLHAPLDRPLRANAGRPSRRRPAVDRSRSSRPWRSPTSTSTAGIFAKMKALGVKVAMDDFGAGHTSFRNLRGLGVDVVKIDGAFVQNIARSVDDRFFVRTLVDLARHLNIETVAEWVEDDEAMRILTEWGIDYLQGHHFGRAEVQDAADFDGPTWRARNARSPLTAGSKPASASCRRGCRAGAAFR